MENEPTPDLVKEFLALVMEIEEKYAFVRKGQDSSRKDAIEKVLENFCSKISK